MSESEWMKARLDHQLLGEKRVSVDPSCSNDCYEAMEEKSFLVAFQACRHRGEKHVVEERRQVEIRQRMEVEIHKGLAGLQMNTRVQDIHKESFLEEGAGMVVERLDTDLAERNRKEVHRHHEEEERPDDSVARRLETKDHLAAVFPLEPFQIVVLVKLAEVECLRQLFLKPLCVGGRCYVKRDAFR